MIVVRRERRPRATDPGKADHKTRYGQNAGHAWGGHVHLREQWGSLGAMRGSQYSSEEAHTAYRLSILAPPTPRMFLFLSGTRLRPCAG